MTAGIPQTSAHFRANLGVLSEAAAQEFSKWAAVKCIHHVMQEENGSTVLYATRQNSRTEQQHKNALRALASNRKIRLNTEASFLRLLHEEYEAIAPDTRASVDQTDTPDDVREGGASPTSCKLEFLTKLPDGFDERASAMLEALVAAKVR